MQAGISEDDLDCAVDVIAAVDAGILQSLRGYPETFQRRRAYVKQHPCGNEKQGDRMERAS